jgi:hydroxylamine reductase (hybrid-cluster protein)
MKELIDRILETEKQAQEQLEAARKKAAALQRTAEEQISREKAELKQESRDLLLKALDAAREEVRGLSAQDLPQERARLLEELGISEGLFQQTAAEVQALLTAQESPQHPSDEKRP